MRILKQSSRFENIGESLTRASTSSCETSRGFTTLACFAFDTRRHNVYKSAINAIPSTTKPCHNTIKPKKAPPPGKRSPTRTQAMWKLNEKVNVSLSKDNEDTANNDRKIRILSLKDVPHVAWLKMEKIN